jgi:hypothetical protein
MRVKQPPTKFSTSEDADVLNVTNATHESLSLCFEVDRMVAERVELNHNFDITCATGIVGAALISRMHAKTLQRSDRKGGQTDETRVLVALLGELECKAVSSCACRGPR